MRRVLAILIAVTTTLFAHAQSFRAATFETDVTVPIGHALMGGGIEPAKEIVDPLYAQGIVLIGDAEPIVWVSIDWCEIRNDAYDAWREAIAEAVDTTRERVLLAAIHQHDAPVADFAAQRLLDEVGLERSLCDVAFVEDCIARTTQAAKEALENAQPVTHYGVGVAEVEGVASNRRIVAADGAVTFSRTSSMPDPAIRAKPIGLIDPNVRTLSFWNGDKPVAAMSTYAVHPMSYYGRGGVSADFIGMARARMQQEVPGAKHLYFSGCSGDVVAGKHNDGTEAERVKLAGRLFEGMREAWANTKKHSLESIAFRNVPLTLPMRETETFTEEAQRRTLNNTSATIFNRNLAAMGLSWRARHSQPIDICAVDFGQAQFLLMPAESFVGYQLAAQEIRPDSIVLVAGYGESAPGYIPTESAIQERFIETHTWCWVGSEAPQAMHDTIKAALTK
jgi:hypothetical protein